MGLRIQNNISAMNAHRNLSISDAGLAKSLERLSSGYRINKAADDAAGLSISQAFRADIASFKVASRNASEASSLLQVAEGALDQIGSMLTRLKELATQAASANSGSNLAKIDAESDQLLLEIERIADSTEYADVSLIDGSYGVTTKGIDGDISTTMGFSGVTGLSQSETYQLTSDVTGASGTMILTTAAGAETKYFTVPSVGSTTGVYFASMGVTISVNSSFNDAMDGKMTAGSSGHSAFQIGAENSANDRLSITLGNAQQTGLGISTLDLGSATNAQKAITSIDAAISTLNTVRGNIGAYMNRLSYASANLASTIENVQAAESVIRDVDMASEMTSFTKNQILLQAGTAMLAQANMSPQQVLSLFG